MKIKYLPHLVLSLLLFQCASTPSRVVKNKTVTKYKSNVIRILLDGDLQSRTISFNSPVVIKSEDNSIATLKKGEKFYFSTDKDKIVLHLGKKKYSLNVCEIDPVAEDDLLNYKGKSYKGAFRIQSSNSKVILINHSDLESYVKGVIYSEMGTASKSEDLEALKAFAVCVRNYTLMKMEESSGAYDVLADFRDQVFNGVQTQKSLINRAVTETEDMILLYNGLPAKVFYFSSCGGYTENCDNVFNQKSIPYLAGVKDGDETYCRISPGFKWEETYTPQELVQYLVRSGTLAKGEYVIKDIVVKSRFDSERVRDLYISVEDKDGQETGVTLTGNGIRSVIRSKVNGGLLKSTLFSLKPQFREGKLSKLVIQGLGNGHGVGLCQWGAIGQSRSGEKYDEILSFYFPGTKLGRL